MQEQVPPQTITIDNFKGALTREIHGDINSGLNPFISTFGGVYPFANNSYNSQLSFIEAPTQISGLVSTSVANPVILFRNIYNPGVADPACLAMGLNGTLSIIRPSITSVPTPDNEGVGNVCGIGPTYTMNYGGGLYAGQFSVDTTAVAYIGNDQGIGKTQNFSFGASFTQLGTGTAWVQNVPRPLEGFVGNLYAANGNNIAEIINGSTISFTARMSPGLPQNYVIRDMKISNDGRYLVSAATFLTDPNDALLLNGNTGTNGNVNIFSPADSVVSLWNGSDNAFSQNIILHGIAISSIAVSNTETLLFGKDDEGVGLWDLGGNKVYSIPEISSVSGSYPPAPGSVYVLGKKIFFLMQYATSGYLFCLDREDNSLYCLYSFGSSSEFIKGGVIIPSLHFMNGINDLTRAKIYFAYGKIPTSTVANNFAYSQHLQNYGGTKFAGTYSTQIQKFAKKISIREVRVFTQPTLTGDSFSVALTGSNGSAYTNGTSTYTFAAGTDKTKGQGALDLIKFYPRLKDIASMGVQVTLITGSPTINKIEIDYVYSDNPKTSG